MDSHEKKARRSALATELVGLSSRRDHNTRAYPKIARLATEVAIESWLPEYEGVDSKTVEAELLTRIRPIVRKRMRDRREEYGFIVTISLSMVLTWILQAIIVTAVATLIQWWIQNRLEHGKLLTALRS